MSVNWNKVRLETDLLSLPNIYWRLRDLVEQEDFAMQDTADLIVCDPGLTARLLRIVNSAYFGFESPVETVSHAVSIIGISRLEELVLTTAIADTFGEIDCEQFDVRQFWLGSIYRAICARHIGAKMVEFEAESMFIAGLLSGIGRLILYQSIPDEAEEARCYSEEAAIPLHLAELEIIGFDHSQVAALLLRNWKLPDNLVMAISQHLEPDPSASYARETALVHVAVGIGNAIASSKSIDEALTGIDTKACQTLGLEAKHYEILPDMIAEQLSDILGLMFPGGPIPGG